MMKEAFKAMSWAVRGLWRNWRVACIVVALYTSLLMVLYLFVATREATALQVLLTLLFAALAPALFFVLQALIVGYAGGEAQALVLLRRSLTESCKLALVSLPLILLAAIFIYLLNKLQPHSYLLFRVAAPGWPMRSVWPLNWGLSYADQRQWSSVMMATLRFMLFGLLLPLLAIHLWSATARDGLLPSLKRAHATLAAAFAPQSVLIYTLGLTLFAIIPYFLIFSHTQAGRAWVEIGLFITRLLLVFLFTIFGWTITVSALNQRMRDE